MEFVSSLHFSLSLAMAIYPPNFLKIKMPLFLSVSAWFVD
jgi:hypothetical protein